jgi:hypothetical protein
MLNRKVIYVESSNYSTFLSSRYTLCWIADTPACLSDDGNYVCWQADDT